MSGGGAYPLSAVVHTPSSVVAQDPRQRRALNVQWSSMAEDSRARKRTTAALSDLAFDGDRRWLNLSRTGKRESERESELEKESERREEERVSQSRETARW